MLIEYETSIYVKEKAQIEIQDTKNVFLQGKNPYDGLNTYFGIWTKKDGIAIVNITSWCNISYEYSLNKNIYTEQYIKKYLENNKNVKIISKEELKKELDHVRSILEIRKI